jgi:hypothetical protein
MAIEKLTREIKQTTDKHSIIEVITTLNAQNKKPLSWEKLDKYVLENGGYYYSNILCVYAKQGEKLGEIVEFDDHKFEVPKKFRELDHLHALFITHEHLDVEGSTIRIKKGHEKHVKVESIPSKNGWYSINKWGFPNRGKSTIEDETARWFLRRTESSYIGLLARGGDFCGCRFVDAGQRPSCRLGVLIEDEKKE